MSILSLVISIRQLLYKTKNKNQVERTEKALHDFYVARCFFVQPVVNYPDLKKSELVRTNTGLYRTRDEKNFYYNAPLTVAVADSLHGRANALPQVVRRLPLPPSPLVSSYERGRLFLRLLSEV